MDDDRLQEILAQSGGRLLKPGESLDVGAVSRFVAEARLMAQIAHPHIMPVFDAGASASPGFDWVNITTVGRVPSGG